MPDPFLLAEAPEPVLLGSEHYVTHTHEENIVTSNTDWEPGEVLYIRAGTYTRQMFQLLDDYATIPVFSYEYWCRKCDVAWIAEGCTSSDRMACWNCGAMTLSPFTEAEKSERYKLYD